MSRLAHKTYVLQAYLQFVASYCPLASAYIATFGGKGIEPRLWEHVSIPADQGWIVERNRALQQRLSVRLRYQLCSRLEELPAALENRYGAEAHLDAFHLDLCGTAERYTTTMHRVLPLITERSVGRCFAITVADQRRNLDLESGEVVPRTFELLGNQRGQEFYEHLLSEQIWIASLRDMAQWPSFFELADPAKGVQRELGIFLHLLDFLQQNRRSKLRVIPDTMKRFVYVSRYGRSPFRMRTYFFHFQSGATSLAPALWSKQMAQLWTMSSLEALINTNSEPATFTRKEKKVMPEFSKLQAIVQAIGGEPLKEFTELMKLAQASESDREILAEVRHALNSRSSTAPPLPAPTISATPAMDKTRRRGRPRADNEENTKLAVQLDLLRASAKGEDALDRAYEAAYTTLGYGRQGNRTRKVGGLLARTMGGWRGNFVKRAIAALGENVVTELAQLYTKIEDETISVSDLKNEAKKSK